MKKLTWAVILISAFAVCYLHTIQIGVKYLENGYQIIRHDAMISGTETVNPWQYRILTEWLVEGFLQLTNGLRLPLANALAFILFRILTDILMFWIFLKYLREWIDPMCEKKPDAACLAILAIMVSGYEWCFFDSGFRYNIYWDVIFYLLAGIILIRLAFWDFKRLWMMPILLFFAALNRETSAGILLMFGLVLIEHVKRCYLFKICRFPWWWKDGSSIPIKYFLLSGVAWLAGFLLPRILFGLRHMMAGYGHPAGIDLFLFNIRSISIISPLIAFTSIPLIALAGWRSWPKLLQSWGIVIGAVWMIHWFVGIVAETPLFLVPWFLIVGPAIYFTIKKKETS